MWSQDTSVAGTMAHLFRGTYTNYVKCINVEDISLRDEVFYDLQMPVSLRHAPALLCLKVRHARP